MRLDSVDGAAVGDLRDLHAGVDGGGLDDGAGDGVEAGVSANADAEEVDQETDQDRGIGDEGVDKEVGVEGAECETGDADEGEEPDDEGAVVVGRAGEEKC